MSKPLKKESPKLDSPASHFMFLDSSIDGTSFEVAHLPSPNDPRESALYLVSGDRLFWLRGIQPNVNPVSLFVGDKIVNEDYFYATFKFDAIFIITSILFRDPDKFISIPQRIYDIYRSGPDESQGCSALEAGAFAVWNHNIDGIRERLEYLCDVLDPADSKDKLFKPNRDKFRAMLDYKVQNLENYVKENNIMMGAYCVSTMTSESNHVRKHHVEYDDRKLRSFAWASISKMLSVEARNCLVPSKVVHPQKICPVEPATNTAPVITSGNKAQKKRKIAGAAGTASIMNFFNPK